jgi:hypothetical protein
VEVPDRFAGLLVFLGGHLMRDERLGPQVLTAVKFLQQIYHDLVVLVQHADKVFEEKEWVPTDRTKVFARLSNRLNAKAWMLTRLHRCYVPRTPGGSVDRVIAVLPVLDPPRGYDEPICVACAVILSRPVRPETFTKNQNRKRFRTLLDRLEGQVGVVELPGEVGSLYPQATRASIVVVPLCDLAGERDLVERLIMPALAKQPAGS